MADYCTVADVRALAGAQAVTDDALLATLITRASAMVDTFTGRVFVGQTTTRAYTPGVDTNANTLYLGAELLSVTTLTTGGVSLAADAYVLHPLNSVRKHYLRLRTGYYWRWPDNPEGSIVLAGVWGYDFTPPADIVQATARLALWLYRQREAPFSRVGNAITGEYEVPVALPDDVRAILAHFRRLLWGAA